jgi:hypothetical protein
MIKTSLSALVSFVSLLPFCDVTANNHTLCWDATDAAIHVYTQEIQLLEGQFPFRDDQLNLKLVSMYSERASLYCSKKNYLAALNDYKTLITVIEQFDITDDSNLLDGICGSMFCYQCLEEEESAKQEFIKLVYHVAMLGDEIESVSWIQNSPVYTTLKEKNRQTGAKKPLAKLPDMTPEEFCELQCGGYAVAASFACLKVPIPSIAVLCGGCVWGLEQLCERCCKGEGFWENCVKPLRRLFHDPEHPNNPAPHPYE